MTSHCSTAGLADALEKPFEESPENSDLEAAPLPHEKVTNTFCGT